MNRYCVYTDGSCRNNGSSDAVGAWGYVIYLNDQKVWEEINTLQTNATNQRAELYGVINACQYMADMIRGYSFDEVHIYTDSAYIHNCLTQKWYDSWQRNNWLNSKKQPVANQDLWKELIPFFENPQFYFYKVAGHANDEKNNYIDALVQAASLRCKNGSNN